MSSRHGLGHQMKFPLQLRYREKENDRYGKRGLSWHISSVVSSSQNQEEDAGCLQEDANRQDLIEKVNTELTVLHPICYDKFDMCECYHNNTLQEFSGAMLKIICSHFEIPVKSRDKKKVLIDRLSKMISECKCVSH